MKVTVKTNALTLTVDGFPRLFWKGDTINVSDEDGSRLTRLGAVTPEDGIGDITDTGADSPVTDESVTESQDESPKDEAPKGNTLEAKKSIKAPAKSAGVDAWRKHLEKLGIDHKNLTRGQMIAAAEAHNN